MEDFSLTLGDSDSSDHFRFFLASPAGEKHVIVNSSKDNS